MQVAVKYRIYPSNEQREFLDRQFGCCRFVYNYYLALREFDRTTPISGKLCNMLTELKQRPEMSFLNEVSAVALQQSIRQLISAYSNFFSGLAKQPRFKTKDSNQSFKLVGHNRILDIRNGKVFLSRCPGLISLRMHRPLPSKPTSATVSKNCAGQYHISFNCDVENISLPSNRSIGIDLGIKDFCITSEGIKYDNPRYFVRGEKRLAKLQRRLSRKQKGSNNSNKAKLKVARLHQHINNQRNDFLHKLSTTLIRENQVICVEDLTAKNMMRNRRLAKHIADVSWGKFCTFLAYKAERYQRQLMIMNTFTPSTQTCSACHVQRATRLTLKERWWECAECGQMHDRDINAARVIHTVGIQYWQRNINNLATLMLVPRWKNGEFLI